MVSRFYGRTRSESIPNPFRCDGFLREGAIPRREGGRVALASLPQFLRALLVTDGTVTKILEAYFWEPVGVTTQRQESVVAEQAIPWIQVRAGDSVLVREAALRGSDSGVLYATALSVIRIERIPDGFRQRLIDRQLGIGVLIRDSGLESYREVMEVDVSTAGGARRPLTPDALGPDDILSRTYRIIIGQEPVILITEGFPVASYR
ncbi:4-hydroxybenzoate synthetase (chorismate lyase) [Thioflavicoccus mobilis 8321]|uniref:4-hydroxybenzoate synthetase (Chorismate lyase) n=1 Tax=Thioflavicoccus mobilis 8321 TaxID=765912 RepID=L0GWY3_9GAMM|nr:chorismate pyruvate-lyase family protein [Thioflavicoccus mobilis]AGA90466.1 4-hydroxybenzoate synthetase (chorismate lyase) [Thioflavicoccus mobilis 8321]